MYSLKKHIASFFLLFVTVTSVFATHYRAGEIIYRQISLLTYEITAITYTDFTRRPADQPEIDIVFGDGKSETVRRANGDGEIVSNSSFNPIKKNIYRTIHTYSGPGNYLISVAERNRVDQIRNINFGNSVNIKFYVESYLRISSAFGFNQSPILKMPPIDNGCRFRTYKHNPFAHDPDGDSLVFSLIPPKKDPGTDVENYVTPFFSDSFAINPQTGELTWETPIFNGAYNIAILIQEYRRGVLIGFVVRDMQIFINDPCNNTPPVISTIRDTCIEALQLLQFNFTATDINPGQLITIRGYGGPFDQDVSPAQLVPATPVGQSPLNATFRWIPFGNAIRNAKHQAGLRATDNDPSNPLSDLKDVNIKVNGPAPRNVQIIQDSNGFILRWNRDTTQLAFGYRIYRRIDSSFWKHGYCETGVPAYTGFTLLDTTQGLNNTVYFDNNFGRGLSPLIRYCYIITTFYPPRSENGSIIFSEPVESYASDEVCGVIELTSPAITNVSVRNTSPSQGSIFIRWIKPMVIDTLNQFPPPYKVQLQRTESGLNNFANVGAELNYPTANLLNDTFLIDTFLNTQNIQYTYRVLLYYTKDGVTRFAAQSIDASSIRAQTINTSRTIILNWLVDVPWLNQKYIIFRKNNLNDWDSIGQSTTNTFADTGLFNGLEYCYFIKSIGGYNPAFLPYISINNSQQICGIPIDTVRPQAPILSIDTPCNSTNVTSVLLRWQYTSTFDQDVVKFKVYWKKSPKNDWVLLDSLLFGSNKYIDNREQIKFSFAGCYAVTAVDSFGNESFFNNQICVDNCPQYGLPNVFTPNNTDNKNSVFKPFPYRFIDKIDMVIYTRWGQEVFKTNDTDINWDGTDQKSGNDCAEGVYYYICEVYESYIDGTRKRTIRGTITLIR
ncbi:MAG: gliding motility-associated C-terminal domain-containing protein [Bacteroidia bacterium]